jgi:hypothetical protein
VSAGDVVLVGIQSWAGLTWHRVRVEKVCPKRARVFWLDCGRRHGTTSYVPLSAIKVAA